MTVLTILSWILLSVAVPSLVWWLVVLLRIGRVAATRPTIRRGVGLPEPDDGWPSVSVIIPRPGQHGAGQGVYPAIV